MTINSEEVAEIGQRVPCVPITLLPTVVTFLYNYSILSKLGD